MSAARPVIGLLGQVCTGKSTVAEAFRRRGAELYEADKLVHELYRRAEVKAEVRKRFGADVFAPDGEVDRKKLGALVFADEAKLAELTREVIFPRTGEALDARLRTFRAGQAPALVLDAPTLLESGRGALCDRLLFVSAPRARREAWARGRGWEPGELARREGRMLDEQEKRKRCDAVLENGGTLEDVDRRVAELWAAWVAPGVRE
ncbi:MAG: dephospho-CoA kinase [Planctomycetota bacterium]|nr:dephospho-CoA kinase [Planctomycetota bacterium]